jgi:hypothetical protein
MKKKRTVFFVAEKNHPSVWLKNKKIKKNTLEWNSFLKPSIGQFFYEENEIKNRRYDFN